MTTLMFLLAATLLIICLLQFAAILGLRSMLKNANEEIGSLSRLFNTCNSRINEMDDVASQVNKTIEEVTRISCELAVANLSARNSQTQIGEHIKMLEQAMADREEYWDMLHEVLTEWSELEKEGW